MSDSVKGKNVFLMLSGGVDSSVAAIQLQEQGYHVTCVFMQCWSQVQLIKLGLDPQLYACSWDEDSEDARHVATKLGLAFEIWDLREEYYNHVVSYMVEEYRAGKTPNPDVMCNSFIKFGVFSERAFVRGADYVATGHYARRVWSEKYQSFLIARAKDSVKDQSYFLARVRPEYIKYLLFPIGEFENKSEVRKIAQSYGLITANKPDSQGICFIGDTPLREILLTTIGQKPGDIVELHTGKILGAHKGAFLFTIGQRHALGMSGGPWFVHSLDVTTNNVYVVHKLQSDNLSSTSLSAKKTNWFVDKLEVNQDVQVRYRQAALRGIVLKADQDFQVEFGEPVRAIAKGQTAAIYDGDLLLGSGIIN